MTMGLFRRTDRSGEIVETLANWITVLEGDGDDRRYLAAQVLRDVLASAVMIQHQDRLERINDVDLEVRWVKSRVDRLMAVTAATWQPPRRSDDDVPYDGQHVVSNKRIEVDTLPPPAPPPSPLSDE